MADKDHFKSSTSAIYGNLKDEDLPDELLSPDSIERKKRDTQRYNESILGAFIYSIKIYYCLLAHRQNEIERARILFESQINEYLSKVASLPELTNIKFNLTDEQFHQIEYLNSRYVLILNTIDAGISELDNTIKSLDGEITVLLQKQIEIRNKLITTWQSQLNNFPVSDSIEIYIKLPDRYTNLPSAKQYEGYIEIDWAKQKQIFEMVGENLTNTYNTISDLNKAAHNEILKYIKQQLEVNWSFIPKQEREIAINERLSEKDIQAIAYCPLLKNITKDARLHELVSELFSLEDSLSKKYIERELAEIHKNDLISLKIQAKKEYDSLKEYHLGKIDLSTAPTVALDKTVNQHIKTATKNVDALDLTINNIQESYNKALLEIQNSSASADKILKDIDQLSIRIKQSQKETPTNIHNIIAKFDEIKKSSDQCIKNMEEKDSEMVGKIDKNNENKAVPKM